MGFLKTIYAVFGAIKEALGLVRDEKLRQAGRDQAGLQQAQEAHDAEKRKDAVKRPSATDVSDSLRDHDF